MISEPRTGQPDTSRERVSLTRAANGERVANGSA